MATLAVLAFLLAPAAPAAEAQVRAVTVTFTDDQGNPGEGLGPGGVALTAVGVEFSSRDRYQVVAEAPKNASFFGAVLIEEGVTDFENRGNYDYVLGELTKKTGGPFETTLSFMGVDAALRKITAQLR